ncbi:LOB domain-containing protein 25-like [Typha angustifolia]|uniref:LOB domain-containing protein 25-like n=1 Tax=Typha angustifolia TaxID=59011 RepID=UPI003C2D9F1F
MASSNPSSSNPPCAACKFLRRKCLPGCIFAPYFPPEEPQKFANVHKIFGASNVTKLLNELLPHQREDAVNSLAYEAEARVKDPVYGCVGAISVLQKQVQWLQKELDAANAELLRYACGDVTTGMPVQQLRAAATPPIGSYQRVEYVSVPYPPSWTNSNPSGESNASEEMDQNERGESSMSPERSTSKFR